MVYDRYYDQIQVGDTGIYGPVTVSTDMVRAFADVTGDHHPLHLDADFAATTRFGRCIAHGFLVLSLSAGLFPMEVGAVVAFYGMDRVRFLRPTHLEDQLRAQLTVSDCEPRGPGGVVTTDLVMLNQDDQAVAVAQLRILVAATPAGAEITRDLPSEPALP